MVNKLRWGILGTGKIAHKFAEGLGGSRSGVLAAVGSRTGEGARNFCAQHPAKAHGSYQGLLEDPGVDVVYISTPHPMHAEWAIKAASAKKHVLCEKPLTMNHAEALEVVAAARENDVFLMEAFMYRCHPQTAKLVELVRAGAVGKVALVDANFSFKAPFDLQWRLFNPRLGGGGVLDVGCYCASMARLIAGAASGMPFLEPARVAAVGTIGPVSHVDEFSVASLEFPNGVLAQLAAGVNLDLEKIVRITGSEGTLVIPNPWSITREAGFSKIILFREGVPQEIVIESDRNLYAIEADTVAEFIGKRQAPAMSWEDSLGNMQTLDRWRAAIGLTYDCER